MTALGAAGRPGARPTRSATSPPTRPTASSWSTAPSRSSTSSTSPRSPPCSCPAGCDADGDGRLSDAELAAYADTACADDAALLALTVDGRPAPLELVTSSAQARPGQGGLPTTLLSCRLSAPVEPRGQVAFTDDSAAGRTGWREVTATARCGSVADADVPADSPSALLTAYPEDQLGSPLDVRSASFTRRARPLHRQRRDRAGRAARAPPRARRAGVVGHGLPRPARPDAPLRAAVRRSSRWSSAPSTRWRPATARRCWPPTSSGSAAPGGRRCSSARSSPSPTPRASCCSARSSHSARWRPRSASSR